VSGLSDLKGTTDEDEWRAICERVLRANSGMGVAEFVAYLKHAFERIVTAFPPVPVSGVPEAVKPSPPGPSHLHPGRRNSSVHDRRQWALQQLLRTIDSIAKEVGALPGLDSFRFAVQEATIKEGFGLAAPLQPPRANEDAVMAI